VAPTITSILHALAGLVSAFLRLGPWAVVVLVVALLWLAVARILRLVESEVRRRPAFVAVVLWLLSRRRR
jgi:hypothetical protein